MRPLRLQSAMEYLTTYGWMFLIFGIAMASIYYLGIVHTNIETQCFLQAGLQCVNLFLAPNGLVTLNLLQVTQTPINVTALACNTNDTAANFVTPHTPSTQVKMQIDSNYTFYVQCWKGASTFSGNPGTTFTGYIFINYTDVVSGFPHQGSGTISVQVT